MLKIKPIPITLWGNRNEMQWLRQENRLSGSRLSSSESQPSSCLRMNIYARTLHQNILHTLCWVMHLCLRWQDVPPSSVWQDSWQSLEDRRFTPDVPLAILVTLLQGLDLGFVEHSYKYLQFYSTITCKSPSLQGRSLTSKTSLMFLMHTDEFLMFLTSIPRSQTHSAWPSCPSMKDSVHTKPLVGELELEIDTLEAAMFQLTMFLNIPASLPWSLLLVCLAHLTSNEARVHTRHFNRQTCVDPQCSWWHLNWNVPVFSSG